MGLIGERAWRRVAPVTRGRFYVLSNKTALARLRRGCVDLAAVRAYLFLDQ